MGCIAKWTATAAAAALVLLFPATANSQDPTRCATVLSPTYSPPVVAKGWRAQLVATGLTRPRGMKFDSNGGLLVVEVGVGITYLNLTDGGGTCLSVASSRTLVNNSDLPSEDGLNHGIDISPDGRTLYASTADAVYSWVYNPDMVSVSLPRALVSNMTNSGGGHVTRTILLSRKQPGLLLVSRGSGRNLDTLASDISSGVSQIRAFNIANLTGEAQPYNYPFDGLRVGWGLRNSVGVDEHPGTGGIFSVENSVDNLSRANRDIHQSNPGEELNYHGVLPSNSNPRDNSSSSSPLGSNYGYPSCFALWDTASFPSLGNLTIGAQFASDPSSPTVNDTTCARDTTPPRLTFDAHMAPLDIKFNTTLSSSPPSPSDQREGHRAFIAFHGSWNRSPPSGYKVSYVAFDAATGQPARASDSRDALVDVLTSPDLSACGTPGNCFRPAGLAFDEGGRRLFVSSDATGEIWVLMRDGEEGGGGSGSAGNGGGGSPTGTGAPVATTSTAAARLVRPGGVGGEWWMVEVVAVMVTVVVAGGLGWVVAV